MTQLHASPSPLPHPNQGPETEDATSHSEPITDRLMFIARTPNASRAIRATATEAATTPRPRRDAQDWTRSGGIVVHVTMPVAPLTETFGALKYAALHHLVPAGAHVIEDDGSLT